MNTQQAYDTWATQYDTNNNKTRDLEREALRTTLAELSFTNCLEIGCGTGKNTEWLITRAKHVTGIDLSLKMLAKAKEKISNQNISFQQADIKRAWTFAGKESYDLITFSLVLEHILSLDHIFSEASKCLLPCGYVYIGELHPYKQYSGTKARFENENGTQIVECFNHNISDFVRIAKQYDLGLIDINEYFDSNDRTTVPRIVTILLKKNNNITHEMPL